MKNVFALAVENKMKNEYVIQKFPKGLKTALLLLFFILKFYPLSTCSNYDQALY